MTDCVIIIYVTYCYGAKLAINPATEPLGVLYVCLDHLNVSFLHQGSCCNV